MLQTPVNSIMATRNGMTARAGMIGPAIVMLLIGQWEVVGWGCQLQRGERMRGSRCLDKSTGSGGSLSGLGFLQCCRIDLLPEEDLSTEWKRNCSSLICPE